MANVITEGKIKEWISANKVIVNGELSCSAGIKYSFRMGTKFLKAYFGIPMDYDTDLKSIEDKRMAAVEPGEVVFVLSEERLQLPSNIYVQLSPKRNLSQNGIELLGGLTVEPRYEGYLVFGLRNITESAFVLKPGMKIVDAIFFELSEMETLYSNKLPVSIEDFPEQLLGLIEKYKPINQPILTDEIQQMQLVYEDQQRQLECDIGELKEKINIISKDLLIGSTKQEQGNNIYNERFSNLDDKLSECNRDTVRQAERINTLITNIAGLQGNFQSMKDDVNNKITYFEESLRELRDDMITKNAKKGMLGTIGAVVITFLVTVLGGIMVALIQGWIG